jgi:arginine N-succinyltransferase
MFYIRPIARDDVGSVLTLSERTGTGLTTLPANRERLASRIERSLASFAGTAARADACYMFVLVDDRSGNATRARQHPDRVVGISAIEVAVGLTEPWYNYHVGTLVHASRALDVYTVAPTLFLANDHTGHTELCSLFLDQGYRQGKNGVLLAKSRLLFIAEFAHLFSPKIIAELRGRLTPDGKSPFWEGLGRHFFAMEYSTADYLTGIGQKSFIAELMPKHPVYVNLLPADARDAIGAVHADTAPARTMLEQEGFRYEGYVDIFDAGPTVECFRDDIHAVRQSQVLPVTLEDDDPVPDSLTDDILWLVANRDIQHFRVLVVRAPARTDRFALKPYAAATLGVAEGGTVRAVPLAPADR